MGQDLKWLSFNTCSLNTLELPKVEAVMYGKGTIRYSGKEKWDSSLNELKSIDI